MIRKTLIWGLGLVVVAALNLPAFADQSIGFQEYFRKGVKAFEAHDEAEALRCFKIAEIYDPNDVQLKKYLDILKQEGVTYELPPSTVPPEESIGYKYYLQKGMEAYQSHDTTKAIYYFNIALIFYPDSKEADRYLRMMAQPVPQKVQPVEEIKSAKEELVSQELARQEETSQQLEQAFRRSTQQVAVAVPSSTSATQTQPATNTAQAPSTTQVQAVSNTAQAPPSPQTQQGAQAQPAVITSTQRQQPANAAQVTYIPPPKPKGPIPVLSLNQLINNGALKPKLQIELHSSLIIEAKNIQRFLIVDEVFIGANIIDADHLRIDALRIGNTFIHIWDDYGRHSIYLEVVFPKSMAPVNPVIGSVQHAQPFIVTYSNDYSTYYQGKDIPKLKRESYYFNQSLAVTGETPYGFFDASGSYTEFNNFSQFDTYTIGLSQIPIEGTSNFNLRGYDAVRYLSPLTMPGTRLRGVFADVDLMDDLVGLSVSHGQEQVPLGFLSTGNAANVSTFNNSYIDAMKLTLFPKSQTDRYSVNFATGYGSDRPSYLSDHVYSLEGLHKFNDFLTLNAEEGNDSSHDSQLASLKWEQGTFRTGLNFRHVDRNYATVSVLPANQGETGASWVTEGIFNNVTLNSFFEAYQEHLFANPDNPRAFNYDGNGQLRVNLTRSIWTDSDFNFIDTEGEISPQKSIQFNQRLSKSFGIWNSLKGTIFTSAGFQSSRATTSNIDNFNRENVIAGIQLPLTNAISSYANFEYDWLDQTHMGGRSHPKVINTGLAYQKQLNPKVSFNAQVDYRNELGIHPSTSILSGQQSVILTSGFSYNPTSNVSFFADGEASKITSHIGNLPYDDFEVHLGVRITFGGATYWDPLGTVAGIVFKDAKGDGKYVRGYEGIPGVKIKVGDKEAVTDAHGRYSVQVHAKAVTVYPVLDTVPGGLLFSTLQTLDVPIIQGRTSKADFGFTSLTGIFGIVFVDKNGTGVPRENDKFVSRVKITLDGKEIQRTDVHGTFYFRKVNPGKHTIVIDINTLAIDLIPTLKLINTIDVAEGTNYVFNVPLQVKKEEREEQ